MNITKVREAVVQCESRMSGFVENLMDEVERLNEQEGVPGRCPRCGLPVWISGSLDQRAICCQNINRIGDCEYTTKTYKTPEEAWREHEQNQKENV